MDKGRWLFETYYDYVSDELMLKGYKKAPDMDEVTKQFNLGIHADDCISSFVKAWGDPGDEEID